jgi:hypothetical protein
MGSAAGAAASDTYRELDLFGDVFERVRADYVEKPEDSKLVESAINGMLAGLDPHSGYMNPYTFRDMQVQTCGEFGGLSIEDAHRGSPRSAALALQHRRGEEARRSPLMTVSAVSPWRTAPFEAAITADYDAQSVVERELGAATCKHPVVATPSHDDGNRIIRDPSSTSV